MKEDGTHEVARMEQALNDSFSCGTSGANEKDEGLWSSSHAAEVGSGQANGTLLALIYTLSFEQDINHVPIPGEGHPAYSALQQENIGSRLEEQ